MSFVCLLVGLGLLKSHCTTGILTLRWMSHPDVQCFDSRLRHQLIGQLPIRCQGNSQGRQFIRLSHLSRPTTSPSSNCTYHIFLSKEENVKWSWNGDSRRLLSPREGASGTSIPISYLIPTIIFPGLRTYPPSITPISFHSCPLH